MEPNARCLWARVNSINFNRDPVLIGKLTLRSSDLEVSYFSARVTALKATNWAITRMLPHYFIILLIIARGESDESDHTMQSHRAAIFRQIRMKGKVLKLSEEERLACWIALPRYVYHREAIRARSNLSWKRDWQIAYHVIKEQGMVWTSVTIPIHTHYILACYEWRAQTSVQSIRTKSSDADRASCLFPGN